MALLRSVQRGFDNVNRTHLVLASGNLVPQKLAEIELSLAIKRHQNKFWLLRLNFKKEDA